MLNNIVLQLLMSIKEKQVIIHLKNYLKRSERQLNNKENQGQLLENQTEANYKTTNNLTELSP